MKIGYFFIILYLIIFCNFEKEAQHLFRKGQNKVQCNTLDLRFFNGKQKE